MTNNQLDAQRMEQELRKVAFEKIMGAMCTPEDGSPDYDEWLFNITWKEAWQACLEANNISVQPGLVEAADHMATQLRNLLVMHCDYADSKHYSAFHIAADNSIKSYQAIRKNKKDTV